MERPDALLASYESGREAWPSVDWPYEAFVAALASRDAVTPHPDLYLAAACLAGVASALSCLERDVLNDVPLAVRRVCSEPDFVEDGVANLRLSLLSGAGDKPPLLARYAGHGPLRSYVMVLAMRQALDRQRRRKEHPVDPAMLGDLVDGEVSTDEPGSGKVRLAFADSLKAALGKLTPRQRTVLRLHVIDGTSADAIGKMYGVHRATATRWITEAKEQVLAATRAHFRESAKASDGTFDSLARDTEHMDLTLTTFLADTD